MTENSPHRDEIASEVRAWYTRSYPRTGYIVEERPFGFYSTHIDPSIPGQVTLKDLAPDDFVAFMSDIEDYFSGKAVRIHVDSRGHDRQTGERIIASGGCRDNETVYLAWSGTVPDEIPVKGLTIQPAGADDLEVYVRTKLMAFADTENEPPREKLDKELILRRTEIKGRGRLLLGRLDGEPAAIIGYYHGKCPYIFHLATRVPYRKMGIARELVRKVLADCLAGGCLTVVIGGEPEGFPIRFYRSFGFTDEVYWRCTYTWKPGTP